MTNLKTAGMGLAKKVVVIGLAGSALAPVGCGAAVDSDGQQGAEAQEGEGAEGTISQAFGEANCGNAPPDVTRTGTGLETFTSTDDLYDHTSCHNAYVLQKPLVAGQVAYAAYGTDPVPPSFGCNGMWVQASLWKNSGGWNKVADGPITYGIPLADGTCGIPRIYMTVPSTGTYKVIAQAAYATDLQKVTVGSVGTTGSVFDMDGHDGRGYTADGDWAPGKAKGECTGDGYILGVSRLTSSPNGIRKVLCDNFAVMSPASGYSLFTGSGSDQRSTKWGNWDPGATAIGECDEKSALTGLAQNGYDVSTPGVVTRARCAPNGSDFARDCHPVIFNASDARLSSKYADWSPGDFKGQCGDFEFAKGFSKDSAGKIRGLLCCERGQLT